MLVHVPFDGHRSLSNSAKPRAPYMSFRRHTSLLVVFALMSRVAHSQNTNNGVIINTNVYVGDPVYVPLPAPVPPPNAFDQTMERIRREDERKDLERRLLEFRTRPYGSGYSLLDGMDNEERYKDLPFYVTTKTVNERKYAGATHAILRQLPKGSVVKLVRGTDDFFDEWWEVFVPGTNETGYVHRSFLKSKR